MCCCDVIERHEKWDSVTFSQGLEQTSDLAPSYLTTTISSLAEQF